MARPIHPLGSSKNALMPPTGNNTTLNSCHFSLSCGPLDAGACDLDWQHPLLASNGHNLEKRYDDLPLLAFGLDLYLSR